MDIRTRTNRSHPAARRALVGGATVVASAVVSLLVACGDSGADSLMGVRSGRGGGPSNGASASDPASTGPSGSTAIGSGGGGGGNTGGGTGGGSGGGSGGGVPLTDAGVPMAKGEQLFRALESSLVTTCGGPGGGCHVTGAYQSGQTPVWLGTPDAYLSAKKYPGIITADPYSSKLLIKGPHEGPAFTGPNKALGDSVLAWLTEEALEITTVSLPSSDPVAVAAGANTVDVSKAGTNIQGAKVTFTAAISGDILTLTNLSVTGATASAIHVVHPLFVMVVNGQDTPDPVDNLSNVDQTVAAGAASPLGSGTVILTGFAAGSQIKVEFTKIETTTATTTDAGTTGGCKSVATFTANATPAIQNNQCLNCHGQAGGSGYGALDLSNVGKNDTLACAQALSRVNLANKTQSDILLAPTGGVAAHPFKGADANYTSMMLTWINNE
jgi:hypothetical protein